MEEERFQQLLTQLVVKKAKEMKPETYNGSEEDTIAALNKNEEDKNQIMDWIKKLGESGELEQELSALEQEQEQMPYFKEGGKLDYLQSLKKGGKMKSKKCSCGCDLITKKEKGGKMVQNCACGCKPKYENGGKIQKLGGGDQIKSVADYYRQKSNAESRRAATKDVWGDIKNTVSDFFRYGDLNYIPKTQYWYDSKKKSGMLRESAKPGQTTAPKTETETVTTPVQTETKVPATTQTAVQPNTNISVVDYLNSMGRASDKASRATLAKELGMGSYNFSAADNLKLLQLIKQKGRNTGNMNIERAGLGVPVNVPGMSIPVPKVQATPAVPGLQDRQGFPTSNSTLDMYTQMYSTPQWQKDLINKK